MISVSLVCPFLIAPWVFSNIYLSITWHLHNKYHSKWNLLTSIFRTNAIAKGSSFYGGGTGPIQLDDLSCTGTEKNLALCGHRGWGKNNCDHTEDASVICVGKFDQMGVKMLYVCCTEKKLKRYLFRYINMDTNYKIWTLAFIFIPLQKFVSQLIMVLSCHCCSSIDTKVWWILF